MSAFFSLSPRNTALNFTDRTQEIWDWFSGSPLHILEIILVALIAQRLGSRAITRAMNRLAAVDLSHGLAATVNRQKERARTTGTVLTSTLNAVIWVIALGMILGEFGLNLGPLIASAGVIGIAFGLGAQTIVRDVLAGLFMLIEDQYGVGDRIDVLEISGKVERVGLRITTVRDEAGTLWYLRNGEILKVGNRSQSG
ncbi:MAG TPA: mechanosensitive ion channel domain-containing protein [Candidatus Paceibacterota bacterium]|nr:mechanosensitive ion channel domain-containing protein [Candidatus Paceibacterota bacterium]